jgi:ribonuclease III
VKLTAAQQAFSARLGHDFANPKLLIEALTHASLSNTEGMDNQRLEFLGDRVLGLTIAEALYTDDPDANEGLLAPRFNGLVRKETCAEIATELDLGPALKMGRSEMTSGGRRKQALLGDAMEAVIAAVYLDAGFDKAREIVLRHWKTRIETVEHAGVDAKTALQEWAQARGLPPPRYVEIERSGPDHAPQFVIEARLKSGETARAEAGSKRAAQQLAAEGLLAQLEPNP